MSAKLREARLQAKFDGEEEKVQVESGSLPPRLVDGMSLNLSDDAKSVESKEERGAKFLAKAREERRAKMVKSPSFKRAVARRKLNLSIESGREQVSSDSGKVHRDGESLLDPSAVVTSEKVKADQLQSQVTAMMQHMKLLEAKLRQVESNNYLLEQDNKELRSRSGSSDSQGGDNSDVKVQGFTPIPKVIGDVHVNKDPVISPTPLPPTSQVYEMKRKPCDGTPNETKVQSIIKGFKQRITLREAVHWEQYKYSIEDVISEQMYDKNLIDITKTWDPNASETLTARKGRVELYKIIIGTLGKEHASKLESSECINHRHNVNPNLHMGHLKSARSTFEDHSGKMQMSLVG